MKKLLSIGAATLLLTSCVTFKEYDKEAGKARDTTADCVVVTTDGNRASAPSIKVKKSNGMYLESATINGTTYSFSNIKAYQDKTGYWEKMAVAPNQFIFVRRLRKGTINLYHYDTYTSSNRREDRGYSDHYAFQKGDTPITELSRENVVLMLQDRPRALQLFRSYFKINSQPVGGDYSLKKITAVIDAYNQGS